MPEDVAALSPGESWRMLHELRVHQVELEMQNEELRRAQLESEASRARYFDLYDLAPVGYLTLSERGLILEANLTAAGLFGVGRGQLIAQPLSRFILSEDQDIHYRQRRQLLATGEPQTYELRMLRADAGPFTARVGASAGRSPDGSLLCRFVLTDVSELKRAEAERLCTAQKMEAVGRLAGSIAHDFNNVLTTIIGYNYLLHQEIKPKRALLGYSGEISRQADYAASLTRQFLGISRRETLQLRALDLNAVMTAMAEILRRMLGERIKLVVKTQPQLWPVRIDSGQIEQVILNLVFNARDAMPAGGRLHIGTKNLALTEAERSAERIPLPPGDYVCFSVRDTGTGMAERVRARIFEFYFTTKESGRGTGLGLSMAWEIVKNAGGHIAVESSPGKGSLFRIYLPRGGEDAAAMLTGGRCKATHGGHETILVVEDNAALLALIQRTLRLKGYRVIPAVNAAQARGLCRERKERMHLLLTDLILPDSKGTELASQLVALRPGLRVVYMSGYSGSPLPGAEIPEGISVLEKPFSPETLLNALRQVLDRSPRSAR